MDKEQKAIERLKLAAEMSETYYNGAPLIVTTSGGKDSDVCLALAKAASIKFEVQHNHTSVDMPETVYHIRKQFKQMESEGIKCTINWPMYKGKPVNMWTLIPQKLMPPTRTVRYCCSILKEDGGTGRMLTTGVRWAESTRRKNSRGIFEKASKDASRRIILKNDNDDNRQLFENCRLRAKRICNPIVDWTNYEIWSYIHSEHIQINPLYQCGFERVGCIGCPLAGRKLREAEFALFPTYKRGYIRAFEKLLEARRNKGAQTNLWRTGMDVFHWWMDDGVLPGQLEMEGI